MLTQGPSRRLLAVAATFVAVMVLATHAATAGSACNNVNGKVTLMSVTGPECASPVGVCTEGTVSGKLKGNLQFTATQITPTVDTPTTGVVLMTGDETVTGKSGTLLIKNAGALTTTGRGEFALVDTIIGGTGDWAGASGALTVTGTFTSSGGTGTYSGTVCTP